MPTTTQLLEKLKRVMQKDPASLATTAAFIEICEETLSYLASATQLPLTSGVSGKSYFTFELGTKRSRAVNLGLFDHSADGPKKLLANLSSTGVTDMSVSEITRACYAMTMAFCCANDLQTKDDRQRPGNYFERLVRHLCARRLGVLPNYEIQVLNLDMGTNLTTDMTFDLGKGRPKFHVPVKTSTRERVIQVWAHQRVIDGIYGMGRFQGMLVCMAETKRDDKTGKVVEICVPEQWRVYQMFIAQLKRFYYLDVPNRYSEFEGTYPILHVRQFGEFFLEADALGEA